MKTCTQCNRYLLFKDFNYSGNKNNLRGNCKRCEYNVTKKRINGERREELLEQQRMTNIKFKYKLSSHEWFILAKSQNFQCAICYNPISSKSHIDHDHTCCKKIPTCGKCTRGILCNNCNVGIGYLKDNIDILENAIKYLRKNL